MKPRVKIFIATLLAVLIIAVGYSALMLMNKKVNYEITAQNPLIADTSATTSRSFQAPDLDQDGLADWEEILWKTDTANPDTDNDGTLDGDEVRSNRNPSVKGPNDLLALQETDRDGKLTQTQTLSRDILVAYLALKQEQGTVSGSAPSLEDLLKKNQVTINAPQYTPAQFTQIADTPTSRETYAQQFTSIINGAMSADQVSEFDIFQNSLKTEDHDLIKELETRATRYRSAVKALAGMAVPKSALALHTDFTNTLSYMAEIVHAMGTVYTDPVTALSGLQNYQGTGLLLAQELRDLSVYFSQTGN